MYRNCFKKALCISCPLQDSYFYSFSQCVSKSLTLHCDEKHADFVISCCVAGVVGDLVPSLVESICSRDTIFGHERYHARIVSGNHWWPVYCRIVFSLVCIVFDVTGASNAKRGSFHVCKYLDMSVFSWIINKDISWKEWFHGWRTLRWF